MNKKKFKINIKNIDLLNEYNRLYYDKNKPKVSDYKYDELKKTVLELERKYVS